MWCVDEGVSYALNSASVNRSTNQIERLETHSNAKSTSGFGAHDHQKKKPPGSCSAAFFLLGHSAKLHAVDGHHVDRNGVVYARLSNISFGMGGGGAFGSRPCTS